MNSELNYDSKKQKRYDILYTGMLITVGIVLTLCFFRLYEMSKTNLINLQRGEVQNINKDVYYILENRRHKIDEDALIISNYLSEGRSDDEILQYLQTEHSAMSILDAEYSDVYAYVHGKFLDGSNWTPGDDFVPTERPWYIEAVKADGDTAFASPYIDAITGNLIISYCMLLDDKETVISYDVQLTNMQKLVSDTVNDTCLETIIIDGNETILADSNSENCSRLFGELDSGYYHELYTNYAQHPDTDFEFSLGGVNYYVFNTDASNGIRQLVVVAAAKMFATLKRALIVGLILLFSIVLFEFLIIRDISKKRVNAEAALNRIRTLYFEVNTDRLTGLGNRRAYEDELDRISAEGFNINQTLISFDLNGLKVVNDTVGHSAGDHLIKGASEVLNKAFGAYGHLYRIGGDEFTAILIIDTATLRKALADLNAATEVWNEVHKLNLSISLGIARCTENTNSVRELIELADKEMYDNKAAYYKNSGMDRRKH